MKSRPRIRFLHLAFAWSVAAASVEARTWHIRPDGTGDAATIQAGIDSAQAGDEVVLAPGNYTWTSQAASGPSMIRMKRDVALRGEVGAASTILDAERRGRVVECINVGDAHIEGLTIENGCLNTYDAQGGGVLSSGDSRLAISNCIIRGNEATGSHGSGGGIHCSGGSITGCEISENLAGAMFMAQGGGVHCRDTDIRDCTIRNNRTSSGGFEGGTEGGGGFAVGGRIVDCRIEDNLSGGSEIWASGGGLSIWSCTMLRCLVIRNRVPGGGSGRFGGGVHASASTITECVFIANSVSGHGVPWWEFWGGAAIAAYLYDTPSMITSCTFVANVAEQDDAQGIPPVGGVALEVGGIVSNCVFAWNVGAACYGPASFSCNDLFGSSGGDAVCGADAGGNFSADPQFCAADPASSLNVAIQSDSPCAPGNHPEGASCGLIGAGLVGCGTVSVQQRTWTEVKSLYR